MVIPIPVAVLESSQDTFRPDTLPYSVSNVAVSCTLLPDTTYLVIPAFGAILILETGLLTVTLQDALLPLPSVAFNVTVALPVDLSLALIRTSPVCLSSDTFTNAELLLTTSQAAGLNPSSPLITALSAADSGAPEPTALNSFRLLTFFPAPSCIATLLILPLTVTVQTAFLLLPSVEAIVTLALPYFSPAEVSVIRTLTRSLPVRVWLLPLQRLHCCS